MTKAPEKTKRLNLYVDEFPGCCGAAVVNNFFVTVYQKLKGWGGRVYEQPGSFEEIPEARMVSKALKQIIKDDCAQEAFVCAILTEDQNKALGKTLERQKFKLVGEGINGKHNTVLYFYLLSKEGEPLPDIDDAVWDPEEY